MKLVAVTISHFRNFLDAQRLVIEDDVTCLVGKNESGKTTILKALHRLNPANGTSHDFDVTIEYPRWRLSRDRKNADLSRVEPVVCEFELDKTERAALSDEAGVPIPEAAKCLASRDYGNRLHLRLQAPIRDVITAVAEGAQLKDAELSALVDAGTLEAAQHQASAQAKQLKDTAAANAKTFRAIARNLAKASFLVDGSEAPASAAPLLKTNLPKFFYFSNYDQLPGEADLTKLSKKLANEEALSPEERTVLALLSFAGETPTDFLDDHYDSRKAELQAASAELTRQAFQYWRQNTDLDVVFDTDMPIVDHTPQGHEIRHRFLKIELSDGRHGGVETNFETRSAGFRWFFSFFAAFSEHQESSEPLIVLLDEPGTSLHGEAQKDFVRFIFEELGSSKQTLYTTHSQYMVDPARYEKLRAVHDRATRENPDAAVIVTPIDLSADRDTVLPVESALGYTISQHLFLGSGHHLVVEGSSDFVYLQRMTEHFMANEENGLDPRLAVIPVGGHSNMPAFVALLGRRLKVTALVDGNRTNAKHQRILNAAEDNGVPESAIVVCSDVNSVPKNADIEDLFEAGDYLRLYNWAFNSQVKKSDLPKTDEPILRKVEQVHGGKFDHALPAHALTEHRDDFFNSVSTKTLERFRDLFDRLNKTLEDAEA